MNLSFYGEFQRCFPAVNSLPRQARGRWVAGFLESEPITLQARLLILKRQLSRENFNLCVALLNQVRHAHLGGGGILNAN
jgi:hypothetical protein